MLIKSFNAGYKSKTAKIYAAQNAKERYKQRDTHQQTFKCVLLGFIVFPPFRPPFGIFHFSVVHTEDNCPVRIVAIYNLAEKREVGREREMVVCWLLSAGEWDTKPLLHSHLLLLWLGLLLLLLLFSISICRRYCWCGCISSAVFIRLNFCWSNRGDKS